MYYPTKNDKNFYIKPYYEQDTKFTTFRKLSFLIQTSIFTGRLKDIIGLRNLDFITRYQALK